MAMSNSVPGSSTLKYDDVINVILSEKNCEKSSGGSTSRSALNAQSRDRTTGRGSNSRMITGIVGDHSIKRKIVGIERKMKEIN